MSVLVRVGENVSLHFFNPLLITRLDGSHGARLAKVRGLNARNAQTKRMA